MKFEFFWEKNKRLKHEKKIAEESELRNKIGRRLYETALVLASKKSIHNGQIKVSIRPNKGKTFSFLISTDRRSVVPNSPDIAQVRVDLSDPKTAIHVFHAPYGPGYYWNIHEVEAAESMIKRIINEY